MKRETVYTPTINAINSDIPTDWCPAIVNTYLLEVPEKNETFNLTRIQNPQKGVCWLYPAGNDFAKETAKVLERERFSC